MKTQKYRGFTLDVGTAVRVWYGENFVGEYPDIVDAQLAVCRILAKD